MILDINFGNTNTKVEIYNSPVTEAWARSYAQFKDIGREYKTEIVKTAVHAGSGWLGEIHPATGLTRQQCIDEINDAIENTNEHILGKQFPYVAYVDMPWSQINNIHRAFTIASLTHKTWKHNLTENQLLELKIISYKDKLPYLIQNTTSEYSVLNLDKFLYHVERINQGIHKYECFVGSTRAKNAEDRVGNTEYIELDWDNFSPSGHRYEFIGERTNYEDLKRSFPDNYDDFDVFIGKKVTGKDYEFAFCQYDDGLEFDITNLDFICGDIRLHYNKSVNDFYTKSQYADWIKDYGLSDELHLPVPLGRIIDSTADFSNVETDFETDFKLSNGNAPLKGEFKNVNTLLKN